MTNPWEVYACALNDELICRHLKAFLARKSSIFKDDLAKLRTPKQQQKEAKCARRFDWKHLAVEFSFSVFIIHSSLHNCHWLTLQPSRSTAEKQQRSAQQMFMIYFVYSTSVSNVWKSRGTKLITRQPKAAATIAANSLQALEGFTFASHVQGNLNFSYQNIVHNDNDGAWNTCCSRPNSHTLSDLNLCSIRFPPAAWIMNSTFSSGIWITKLLMMRAAPARFLTHKPSRYNLRRLPRTKWIANI